MVKMVGLIITTLLVVFSAGSGTYAIFSRPGETSQPDFADHKPVIAVAEQTSTTKSKFFLSCAAPGEAGSKRYTVQNMSNRSSELDIIFSAITNTGGSGGGEFEDGVGNLGTAGEIAAFLDADQNGNWSSGDVGLRSDGITYNYPSSLNFSTINSYGETTWNTVKLMEAMASENFIILWRVTDTTGNAIQGDSVSFTVDFILTP
jgi:hypothetical protein